MLLADSMRLVISFHISSGHERLGLLKAEASVGAHEDTKTLEVSLYGVEDRQEDEFKISDFPISPPDRSTTEST